MITRVCVWHIHPITPHPPTQQILVSHTQSALHTQACKHMQKIMSITWCVCVCVLHLFKPPRVDAKWPSCRLLR